MPDRLRQTQFLLGARAAGQFPLDSGAEVALAGRSNAGKSSALNALTGHRALARVSKTPGRTREINFFGLEADRRLVDLPGYGYAQVPEELKRLWGALTTHYMKSRRSLRGVVVIMDVRHPMTTHDLRMLGLCGGRDIPTHILLSKADKLSRGAAQAALHLVRHRLSEDYGDHFSAQLFSATRGTGVSEACAVVRGWLD